MVSLFIINTEATVLIAEGLMPRSKLTGSVHLLIFHRKQQLSILRLEYNYRVLTSQL